MENQGIPQPPPGVRFNPTEEELVGYYLKKWVNSEPDDGFIFIPDIEPGLEPWDIKDKAKILGHEEQKEWYYFVRKKRRYGTGTKIDRTTKAGFWKKSGSDTPVFSKNGEKIGTRTSLFFHTGRACQATRTNWITYEYRLLTYPHGPPDQPQAYQEWVICKGFVKKSPPNNKSRLESSNNDFPIEAIPSDTSSTMHHNDPPYPIFNQTSSFNQFTFNPPHHDQDSQIGFENQLVDELPQLPGISNTNSTIFGTSTTQDQGLYVQNSAAYNMSANNEEERSSQFMIDPATPYYLPNLPPSSITSTDDDRISQLLEDYSNNVRFARY